MDLIQGNCSRSQPEITTLCSSEAHWATIRKSSTAMISKCPYSSISVAATLVGEKGDGVGGRGEVASQAVLNGYLGLR